MKLAIIRFIIHWLLSNHKFLLMEAVVGPEAHIHLNPRKRAKPMSSDAYRADLDAIEREADETR